MSMNTEVEHPYIMFEKGKNVIFRATRILNAE